MSSLAFQHSRAAQTTVWSHLVSIRPEVLHKYMPGLQGEEVLLRQPRFCSASALQGVPEAASQPWATPSQGTELSAPQGRCGREGTLLCPSIPAALPRVRHTWMFSLLIRGCEYRQLVELSSGLREE